MPKKVKIIYTPKQKKRYDELLSIIEDLNYKSKKISIKAREMIEHTNELSEISKKISTLF